MRPARKNKEAKEGWGPAARGIAPRRAAIVAGGARMAIERGVVIDSLKNRLFRARHRLPGGVPGNLSIRRIMAEKTDKGSIERFREEIDTIDKELLYLLNRRASCALSIGEIKKARNLPIHVPEREERILLRMVAENPGPITGSAVRVVFRTIFSEMKKLELQELGEAPQ